MNKQLPSILQAAALLFAIAVAAVGCRSDEEPRNEPQATDTTVTLDGISFSPQLPDGNRLDTIIRADLDGNGSDELIVASLGRDSIAPAIARADYIQFYTLDSAQRRYRLLYADSMLWASGISVRRLARTGGPVVIVTTDGGGNDEIATRGMSIYSGAGGGVGRIFQTNRGNPWIESLPGPDIARIVMEGQYWPPFMNHSQALRYIDDYLALRDGKLVSVRREYHEQFVAKAQEALARYGALRDRFKADTLRTGDSALAAANDSVDGPHPLFSPAALAILTLGRGGADRSLRSFWGSEWEYLERRIPPEQFQELATLYATMVEHP